MDSDGRILFIEVDKKTQKRNVVQTLGFEQSAPAAFPFKSSIPRDQVLTSLRRLSCAEGDWRIWVALAIGLGPNPVLKDQFMRKNFLYIFREQGDKKETLVTRSYEEVMDLVLDDVNGDSLNEIVVQAVNGQATLLAMWQVGQDGAVSAISLKNVRLDFSTHQTMRLGSYKEGVFEIWTEENQNMGDYNLTLSKSYRWNKANRRYELVSSDKTETRGVK